MHTSAGAACVRDDGADSPGLCACVPFRLKVKQIGVRVNQPCNSQDFTHLLYDALRRFRSASKKGEKATGEQVAKLEIAK